MMENEELRYRIISLCYYRIDNDVMEILGYNDSFLMKILWESYIFI